MAKLTHLYILVFPKCGMIKIGKADEVYNRIQSLKRWWGEPDYEASYHLTATSDLVFSLEKSLHFMLSVYSCGFGEGDGRTELFSSRALTPALGHIDLFCKSGAVEPLKKGVLLPAPTVGGSKRLREKYHKYIVRNEWLKGSATQIILRFFRINRLLIILLRKKNSLAYQWDIVDGHVHFRVRRLMSTEQLQTDKLWCMFTFRLTTLFGESTYSCCSSTIYDQSGILQYSVRLPTADEKNPHGRLFYDLFLQSELLLDKLPKRSPAAIEEIPMLK